MQTREPCLFQVGLSRDSDDLLSELEHRRAPFPVPPSRLDFSINSFSVTTLNSKMSDTSRRFRFRIRYEISTPNARFRFWDDIILPGGKDGKVILQVGCHQRLETSCISIDDGIAKVQRIFTNGCLRSVYYPFSPFRNYFCIWNSEERSRLLIDEHKSNGLFNHVPRTGPLQRFAQ